MELIKNSSEPFGAIIPNCAGGVDLPALVEPDHDQESRPATTSLVDRRSQERFVLSNFCPVRLLTRPSLQPFQGFIREVSREGIGLVVSRSVEPGTLLAIQLRKRLTGVSEILTAQARHATPVSPFHWLVGCRFSRNLTDEEMAALLRRDGLAKES
jgi:PilZ domain